MLGSKQKKDTNFLEKCHIVYDTDVITKEKFDIIVIGPRMCWVPGPGMLGCTEPIANTFFFFFHCQYLLKGVLRLFLSVLWFGDCWVLNL